MEQLEERCLLSADLVPSTAIWPQQLDPAAEVSRSLDSRWTAPTVEGNSTLISFESWVLQGPAPTFSAQVNIPPNNPVSGAIQAVAPHPTDPNILYLGAVNGGVWKTTNATASSPTWTPLTDALPGQSITSISLDLTDPTYQTLIVGTGRRSSYASVGDDEVGLYYTTNGGTTWTQFNQSLLQNQAFYGVAARGNVILAGSPTNGIYRSTNGGVSWSLISGTNGLLSGGVFDLVGDPGNTNRLYAAVSGRGVFRTDDAGATWTNVSTGVTGASTAQNMRLGVHDSGGNNVVYVGVINSSSQVGGVFRSTDQGGSWTVMDVPSIHPGQQGYLHFSLAAHPTNPNLVFIGGDRITASPYTGNVVRGDASQPLGSQFTSIVGSGGSNTSPHADSRYLGFDANGNLLEGDDGGIYRRSNPTTSDSWGSVIGNLAVMEAHDVAWNSISHTAIIGTQDNGTHQQLTPAGTTTWQFIYGGDGGDVAVDNITLAGSNRAIRYFSSQNLGKSSAGDAGNLQRQVIDANNNVISTTFINASSITDYQFVTPIKLDAINPQRLLVGGSSNLYESLNQGGSFTNLGSPGANGTTSGNPLVYGGRSGGVDNPDLIYVGKGGTVYKRTTAGGAITATSVLPSGASTIKDVAINPDEWNTVFAIDNNQEFMSLNAGVTWTDVTGNLSSISSFDFRSLEFVPGIADNSVVVGTRSGVFASRLSSIGTWERVGTGLPDVLAIDLDYNAADDVLVAGTMGRSVWTFANASTELNGASVNGIDLVGTSFDVVPDNFFTAGGQASTSLSVRNLGDTAAGAFDVQFYLSDDAVIDPATDLLLTLATSDPNYNPAEPEAYHVSSLASLTTNTATVGLAVPVSDPFGTDNQYYVGMVVDADGDVTEADETNNRNRGQGLDRDDVEFSNNIASFPFFEDWEAGTTFRPSWQVIPGAEGRIQITSANTPYQGTYHVTLDDSIDGSADSLNQLILHINLAGRPSVRLQFANKEFSDEDNVEDSVDVSVDGGSTWHQVVALTGSNSTSTYTPRTYDLDSLSLTYSSDTLIRFQQFDNFSIPTDGMAFDNIRVDSFAVPGIDLAGTSFDVVPDNFFAAGGQVSTSLGVRNLGDTAAGAFDVQFYLSDDAIIDPATDLLLTLATSDPNYNPTEPEAYHVSSLASLATHTASVTLAVPTADPFGTDNQYYVGMVVDADADVTEADETNNRNRGQDLDRDDVNYSPPFIDLLGTNFDVVPDNFFAAGGQASANLSVRNVGDTAAGAFDVQFYLSDDANIDPSTDLLLTLATSDPNYNPAEPEAYHVSSLASLTTHNASVSLAVPVSDPFGTDNQYYLGMFVDADADVTEADETNNRNRGQDLDRDDVFYSSIFSNPSAIAIPDSGASTPYPSNINVSGLSGTVTDVNVSLFGFTHTYPDDVDILLVGPAGQKMILLSDVGGSLDITGVNLTLDDAAAGSLPDESLLTSGTFKPTNIGSSDTFPSPAPAGPYASTLATFNGSNPNGTWSLYVYDDLGGDFGSISGGWSLTINTNTSPTNPVDVALTAIDEDVDNASNSGTLASAIVTASGSTDVDPNTLGVAATAVDNSHGQWQYSTNGGGVWQDLLAASTTSARLLDPANRLRFVPNANFNSQIGPAPTISFKVWDETAGVAGGTADTTTGTAFSALAAQLTEPITAINDAPIFSLTSNLVQTYEGAGAVTISGFATGMAPGPSSATDEASQIVTFQVSVTGSSGGLVFDVAPAIDSATGALTFTAAANANGNATVEVALQDNGSGVAPNVNTSAAQTFTIEIRPFAGDYNRDHTVDGGDYLLWRKTLGATVTNNYSGADGSGDGTVGQEDYDIWRANSGNVLPTASGSGVELAQDSFQVETAVEVASTVDRNETSAYAGSATVVQAVEVQKQSPTAVPTAPAIDSPINAYSVLAIGSTPETGRPSTRESSSERNPVRTISNRQDEGLMAWLSRRMSVRDSADRKMANPDHDEKADAGDSQLESIDDAFATLAGSSLARGVAGLKALQ